MRHFTVTDLYIIRDMAQHILKENLGKRGWSGASAVQKASGLLRRTYKSLELRYKD